MSENKMSKQVEYFKSSDFEDAIYSRPHDILYDVVADVANEKLTKLIEAAPVVFGKPLHPTNTDPEDLKRYQWSKNKISGDTHQARLFHIEEIEKKECKHEPVGRFGPKGARPYEGSVTSHAFGLVQPSSYECLKCGVELQAEWKVKG